MDNDKPASADSGFEVGHRLRFIRETRGLSQRELARRAGMPNGNLSMIEQGKVSPSIGSLEKILRAVPMTLEEFFSSAEPTPDPVLRRADALHVAKPGFSLDVHSLKRFGSGRTYLAAQTLTSGECASADWLMAPAVIWGLLVRGAVELKLGQQTHRLDEGDGFYFGSSLKHSFRNLLPSPAQLVLNATLVAV